jgi:hypothetical protein
MLINYCNPEIVGDVNKLYSFATPFIPTATKVVNKPFTMTMPFIPTATKVINKPFTLTTKVEPETVEKAQQTQHIESAPIQEEGISVPPIPGPEYYSEPPKPKFPILLAIAGIGIGGFLLFKG